MNEAVNSIEFIEWVVSLLPPEYDMDVRRRFTPQVPYKDEELYWIETHKNDHKFYTTNEVYNMWLDTKKNRVNSTH